ncbi:uncharacterized protein LOC120543348 [Polypterus senegalus]|uniref:uncharacterized protein LOC120543348 n=1 Tax=Polypterus senegalus TaxID=55291 RepID=UPI001963AAEE|nr:uncharacterized protein LOC120543348 [Polypterus senegalus]
MKAFDSVFTSLSLEQSKAVFSFAEGYLKRVVQNGFACALPGEDSQMWLMENYGQFCIFAQYSDFVLLNYNFNGFEVIQLLTAVQLADLTVMSTALSNTTEIQLIFSYLVKGNAVYNFAEYFSELSSQKVTVHNSDVGAFMIEQVYQIVGPYFFTISSSERAEWLQVALVPVLPWINPQMVASAISNTSCAEYQAILSGLGGAAADMSPETKKEIAHVLLNYLQEKRSASECYTEGIGIGEWINQNFGPFAESLNAQDIIDLNPNLQKLNDLDTLPPTKIAALIFDSSVGALDSVWVASYTFDVLMNFISEEEIEVFFDSFVSFASKNNVTVIRNTQVRETMLNKTFEALLPYWVYFNSSDVYDWFTVRLSLLLPSVNSDVLGSIPLSITCNSYKAVIQGLTDVSQSLTVEQRDDIFSFSRNYLLTSSEGSSCSGSITSSRQCLTQILGPFYTSASYLELSQLCGNLNGKEVLELLSTAQVAQFTVHLLLEDEDSEMLVSDISEITMSSLFQENIDTFFYQFQTSALQQNLTVIKNTKVATLMLYRAITILTLRFPSFTLLDWQVWFQVKLAPLLSGVNVNILSALPQNISCESYQAIMKAFDSVFTSLSLEQSKAVFSFAEGYLKRVVQNGFACALPGEDSQMWLMENYGQFCIFAQYSDFVLLNYNFNGFEVIQLLTAVQLADLTVMSTALSNTTEIQLIFSYLVKGNAVYNFAEYFSELSSQKVTVHNSDVGAFMIEQVYQIVGPYFFTISSSERAEWLQVALVPVLPWINPQMVASAISNTSCAEYQAILSGLGGAAADMSPETKKEIAHVLLNYLQEKRSASECYTEGIGIGEWINQNFGPFAESLNAQDIIDLNPNLQKLNDLDTLPPTKIAALIFDSSVGALDSVWVASYTFDVLMNFISEEEIEVFFDSFVSFASKNNVTVIRNTQVRETMLNKTFEALLPYWVYFNSSDVYDWFTVRLSLLLPSVNSDVLGSIPLSITCNSYKAVIQGLTDVSQSLTVEQRDDIFSFSRNYLLTSSEGSSCSGSITSSRQCLTQILGPFYTSASYLELSQLCGNLNGKEVLELLSTAQVAQFTVHLLLEDEDSEMLVSDISEITMSSLFQENIDTFFYQFQTSALQQNLTVIKNTKVATLMLYRAITILTLRFPSFTLLDWQVWFQVKLAPLLSGVNVNILSALPQNISCESYQAIMKAFDSVFTSLSLEQSKAVFSFAEGYLKRVVQNGFACALPGEDSQMWLMENYGQFCIFAQYSDFVLLNYNFNGFEVIQLLTAVQLADLTVMSTALSNTTEIQLIFSYLVKGNAVYNFAEYFSELSSQKVTVHNSDVGAFMIEQVYQIVGPYFFTISSSERAEWLQVALVPVLPWINPQMVASAISNTSCAEYQAILSGLGGAAADMSPETKKEIAHVLLNYLQEKRSASECYTEGIGIGEWINQNFGPFAESLNAQDIIDLNPNLQKLNDLDTLPPTKIAALIFDSSVGALDSVWVASYTFDVLMNFISEEEIEVFFDSFVSFASKNNVTVIRNTQVRETMLNKTFEALLPYWVYFNSSDVYDWFTVRLSLLLPSVNSDVLGSIPLSITCNSYKAVIQGLTDVSQSLTVEQRDDIFSFSRNYLLTSSEGSSCSGSITSSRQCLTQILGPFYTSASYLELSQLCGNLNGKEVLELLSTAQVAQFTVHLLLEDEDSEMLVSDISEITMSSLFQENIDTFFYQFQTSALQQNLTVIKNTKVATLMLYRAITILTLRFPSFTLLDWQVWFQVKLAPLLSGVNVNILSALPQNISCESYQAIMKAFDSVFTSLSLEQSKAVFSFAEGYLKRVVQNGFACALPGEDSQMWLMENYGQFCIFAQYSDFVLLNYNFNGFEVIQLLTAVQLADLTVMSTALSNTTEIQLIFSYLVKGNAVYNFAEYFSELSSQT